MMGLGLPCSHCTIATQSGSSEDQHLGLHVGPESQAMVKAYLVKVCIQANSPCETQGKKIRQKTLKWINLNPVELCKMLS